MEPAGPARVERRLAATLAADVAGYSRLKGAGEEGTLERLKALRRELVDPKIAGHKGHIIKTTGDGLLVEFTGVVDAVRCAVEVQQAMPEQSTGVGADTRIELRIGINLDDVIVEGDDSMATASTLPPGSKPWPIPAGSSSPIRFMTRWRPPALRLRGSRRAAGQEHRSARPRLPSAGHRREEPVDAGFIAAVAPRQAVDRGIALRQHERRPGAGIFCRRYGRRNHYVTLPHPLALCDRPNSSFTYKGQAVDVKQVGWELGVRYVLEGSARKAGGRLRITAQLIDAVTGVHLWADRFDGSLEDVFELQDKLASSVAGVIEPALQASETGHSAHRPTDDLTAYDLYLRAYAMVFSSRARVLDAMGLLEEAIARDPGYGPALAWAAICCQAIANDSRSDDLEGVRRKGLDFARRALEAARDDPGTLANAALALGYFGEDISGTIALVDRALALNPSFARLAH